MNRSETVKGMVAESRIFQATGEARVTCTESERSPVTGAVLGLLNEHKDLHLRTFRRLLTCAWLNTVLHFKTKYKNPGEKSWYSLGPASWQRRWRGAEGFRNRAGAEIAPEDGRENTTFSPTECFRRSCKR